LFSSQSPDPSALDGVHNIEPAAGKATGSVSQIIDRDGHFEMRTILMEPRDSTLETLEAPMRITAEWVPVFKIGTPITVQLDGSGQTYPGKIVRIESTTDSTGTTVQAIAEIDKRKVKNSADLQPGIMGLASMVAVR
jgi:hypothetical protein